MQRYISYWMACRKNTLISQMRKKFLCKKKQKNCVHCCFKMMNLVFYFSEKCNDINVMKCITLTINMLHLIQVQSIRPKVTSIKMMNSSSPKTFICDEWKKLCSYWLIERYFFKLKDFFLSIEIEKYKHVQ